MFPGNGSLGPPGRGQMPVVKLTLDGVDVRTGTRLVDGVSRRFIEFGPVGLVIELPFDDEGARAIAGGLVGVEIAVELPKD